MQQSKNQKMNSQENNQTIKKCKIRTLFNSKLPLPSNNQN